MTRNVTPLRERMIDDMVLRNMSPSTQKVCTQAVANVARFFHQSPDQLGLEHVRLYRLDLAKRRLKATSINPIVGGLRFFYGVILDRKDIAEEIPFPRKEETLPAVLTQAEVVRLIAAVDSAKMRAALITVSLQCGHKRVPNLTALLRLLPRRYFCIREDEKAGVNRA